ncbi:hypothetical protein DSO57_1016054 [Entomophthora muscae]|uniref:Uncharacterized protein n=1 Tax=Entomophthora muscae TaxID=34485 RepID=A0ACC2UQL9_9FUNG|nr:hypothetical protein DSO57_1016054 [Entomophthora muscae]
MRVCDLLVKLLLLASCSGLKECGFKALTKLINVDVSCEKWYGDIDIDQYYKGDSSKEFMLQEVAGTLNVAGELPINLKWPLKVSRIMLVRGAMSDSYDFSQIAAEEIVIDASQEKLTIVEPSVFKWKYGHIDSISGIKGTRLKYVELSNEARSRIHFDNVTHLDTLVFHGNLYPTFPNLTYVKHITALSLDYKFDMDIQRVGKLEVTKANYLRGQSILLNKLEATEDVIIASGKFNLFSAPKLTWGRLELKHVTKLNLNESLRWKGTSFITSDDFCEKYFKAFVGRGLAFKTNNRCEVDCKQPYTPASLTLHMSCETFKTIEINQKSVEYIPLYEAAAVTGDLIITNYNGTFSAPKLTVITENVIITNSNNFSFSAPNLKKIQGIVTIKNFSSFLAPNLKEIHGYIFIINSGSFSALNLNQIQGSVTVQNLSSFSADNLNEFQGNIIIKNSSFFSAYNLKKIQGDINILDSSSFHVPNLEKLQGSISLHASNLLASDLEEVWGNISIKNSNDFSFPKLKKVKGNLKFTNSNPSSRQALYHLESVKSIDFHQQTNNIEFKSLKAIDTLRIHNSSLISITGIDVTQLEDLIIEGCPRLNHMPLLDLKVVTSAYISAAGIEDISRIFFASFNVTKQITIANFQHDQLHLNLLSAGQLTLKDNSNLEVIHVKAEHLTSPIKTINNPNLHVVKFKKMRINYKLHLSNFKVLTASTEKELQIPGSPNAGN